MLSSYRLERIPQDTSLQAWNAADELYLSEHHQDQGQTLLINDHFGALAVALHNEGVLWWSPSAMSKEALKLNCELNRVPLPQIVSKMTDQLEVDSVVIQLPKSTNLFAWQLEHVSRCLKPTGKIYVLAMAKHVSNGHISVMNSLFKQVNPGRAQKKARVIQLSEPTLQTVTKQIVQSSNQLSRDLINLPGCFAEKTVDQGAQVFIDHFEQLPSASRALDLGCGNGILSIAYLQRHSPVQMDLVDENEQAIQSAQLNLKDTHLTTIINFVHGNGLNDLANNRYDLILCNPPFHQENTLTERIAEKLFLDARQALEEDGEFWVVANRHLTYAFLLKRIFKSVQQLSKHHKFNVFRCTK